MLHTAVTQSGRRKGLTVVQKRSMEMILDASERSMEMIRDGTNPTSGFPPLPWTLAVSFPFVFVLAKSFLNIQIFTQITHFV